MKKLIIALSALAVCGAGMADVKMVKGKNSVMAKGQLSLQKDIDIMKKFSAMCAKKGDMMFMAMNKKTDQWVVGCKKMPMKKGVAAKK